MGIPLSIISDRGAQLTFSFFRSFRKWLGTAFHPGQVERTIQTLEDMAKVCIIDFKGNWD